MNGTCSCGCCDCLTGTGAPIEVTNRPGLSAIRYRIGEHATFFESMIRRLTFPVIANGQAEYSLHSLTTRERDDPSIAFLDAWATVADVLTFYQERIANESYLRTATERRSLLELGRLVGYKLKPGVAASAYLAYTMEETAVSVIPAGTKAQSIPGTNEQPQMFETSVDSEARGAWNALLPRMRRPQVITLDNVLTIDAIWIDGINTRLEKRDALLFVFAQRSRKRERIYAIRRALATEIDTTFNRTKVLLEPVRPYYTDLYEPLLRLWNDPQGNPSDAQVNLMKQILLGTPREVLIAIFAKFKIDGLDSPDDDAPPPKPKDEIDAATLIESLVKNRGVGPRTQWNVSRTLKRSLQSSSDYTARLLGEFYPQLDSTIYTALENLDSGGDADLTGVFVLRRRYAAFGYNAPTVLFEERPDLNVGKKAAPKKAPPAQKSSNTAAPAAPPIPQTVIDEQSDAIYLDSPGESIAGGSYVVIVNDDGTAVSTVRSADTKPRTAYGISAKSTWLQLADDWFEFTDPRKGDPIAGMIDNLKTLRRTSVLAESEELTLAQEPLDRPVGQPADSNDPKSESQTRVELDTIVEGLAPGHFVIVAGERFDTGGTSGVISAELAIIENVELNVDPGSGGTSHSILVFAPAGLAYQYKRSTVKINANVIPATNGERHDEILGAGDAATSMQTFRLRQQPLTFTSAPTPSGIVSTLAVRVNDVLWYEADSIESASPSDRVFVTKIADDGKVSIIFGTGAHGARIPTGTDNVRASYRSGIGKGGNVRARQVATAISRPLGVRDVVNPIEASGGADPESRDEARRNIPVSLQAMKRVVSIRDYADFARTFAGIAKASAVMLTDRRRQLVHLTIGGTGDIDIDATSDLYRNLVIALRDFGDAYQPFVVATRDKIVVAGSARVRIDSAYLWTLVAPKIRAALLDAFSYDRRELGQPLYPAEVVAVIQNVSGVEYVDLDALGGIHASQLVRFDQPQTFTKGQRVFHINRGPRLPNIEAVNPILPRLARRSHHALQPAQIAYIPEALADLFILTEIPHA